MNVYDLTTLVHVAAAVVLLAGSIIASPAIRAAVRRAGTTQEMRAYLSLAHPLSKLEPGSAVVVLASGIYLTSVASFWTLGWVQVAVAGWVLNAIVAATMVNPTLKQLTGNAEGSPDGPVGLELDRIRHSARWSIGGDVLLSTDASMLCVMVIQPGLAGSLLTLFIVNAAVAVLRMTRTHGPAARAGAAAHA